MHCDVCGAVLSGAKPGMPCPRCHGTLVRWLDREVNASRSVRRIKKPQTIPLVAKEHTAQITTDDRLDYETAFKAPAAESKVNVLACSPTLEMGIDVGGLDAVVMRNIPPRPDNYAQRGGRAGRRSRVGLVLGYARSTPHDQYFYDKPREMIAGEVPAPAVSLGNRDVLVRHLYAIAFGAAEPGLAGQDGRIRQAQRDDQPGGRRCPDRSRQGPVRACPGGCPPGVGRRRAGQGRAGRGEAHGPAGRSCPSGFSMLWIAPPGRSRSCGSRWMQFAEGLQEGLCGDAGRRPDQPAAGHPCGHPAWRPGRRRPLGGLSAAAAGGVRHPARLRVPLATGGAAAAGRQARGRPDLRRAAAGHRPVPARGPRLCPVEAVEGHRPGHGIALEPAQRGANVVVPRLQLVRTAIQRRRAEVPPLRHGQLRASHCRPTSLRASWPCRTRSPILDEEERYAERNLVRTYPQWGGDVVGRWTVGSSWALRLSRNEEVRWVNEGRPPTPKDLEEGLVLHRRAKGYLVCPSCGRMLRAAGAGKGRRWPPQRQDREEAGRHRPHGRLPAPRQQPRAAGDQHCRADRGPAAARAGARAQREGSVDLVGHVARLLAPGRDTAFLHAGLGRVGLRAGRAVADRATPRPATACSRWPSSTPAWAAAATWSGSRSSSTRPPSRPSSIWTTPIAKRPATAA